MTTRVNLAHVSPLPRPFTIFVEPTNVCNFKCSFCPVSLPDYVEESGFHGHMTMGLYYEVIQQIKELGRVRALKLYFIGEPFLNPALAEMIAIAKQANIADRIEVTTNGSIFRTDVLNVGLDDLRVSIYTTGMTKITRNIKRWMAMREALGQDSPRVTVRFMPTTKADEEKFVETYGPLVDSLQIEGFHSWASTSGLRHIDAAPKRKACSLIHYMLVVKANGDVVPCCVDWNASLRLGNVQHETLRQMWDGAARESLILTHALGRRREVASCASCNMPDAYPDDVDALTADEYLARKAQR